jgi:GNAT superfamily N-acetyltransferase
MENLVIRKAVLGDIPSLCELYFEFHEHHARSIPDRLQSLGLYENFKPDSLISSLDSIITDEDAVIFVVENSGDLIGFVEAYVREDEDNSMRISYRHSYLQSLMVKDVHREGGIGRRLLEAVEEWAKDKFAVEMRVDIWEFTGNPLGFYEEMGYRTLRRSLIKSL